MTSKIDDEFEDLVTKLSIYCEEISLGALKSTEISSTSEIMKDLNFDSLDYASLMLMGEQYLDTKITESGVNWSEIKSIGDLATLLLRSRVS